MKRATDLILGTVLLLLLLPLFGAIAAAIKLAGGPGPILCQQERVRSGDGTFRMWRFRCLAGGVTEQTHPSSVGRWLRRTNCDRLPALVNVVRGDIGFDELTAP